MWNWCSIQTSWNTFPNDAGLMFFSVGAVAFLFAPKCSEFSGLSKLNWGGITVHTPAHAQTMFNGHFPRWIWARSPFFLLHLLLSLELFYILFDIIPRSLTWSSYLPCPAAVRHRKMLDSVCVIFVLNMPKPSQSVWLRLSLSHCHFCIFYQLT